ncbi:DUF5686 and carboxypeptidase-like regulatory domain-containing protein [Thermaurantimonas aggregans]|uniref:DUF5686 and carboxypeptidase-like regulatory domain-containing protein n=1 Tax=Thermaurantimonas aggregans TaxID=2173829 RepID=UPI000F57245B|nr:DUF5686 and carboxypeptidase-like regulatory domain-containing protein [Thermaurantimonas aggregans]
MANTIKSKILFVLLCKLFIYSAFSQSFSGILIDAQTGERLPFGNIVVKNSKRGTSSDIEGRFQLVLLPTDSVLIFSYAGYEKLELNIRKASCTVNCTIALKPTSLLIAEVKVYPGENPALRIISQVRNNKDRNDPEGLDSYYYKAYNKLVIAFDTNDLKVIRDSINPEKIDSFALRAIEFSNRQYLFLSESVSERRYLKPNKVNETVLASRISGIKNPLFSILATQLQSFSFYRDEFELFNITLDNPISKKAENQYFYLIEDTLYDRPDADTVFVISFRPRPGHEHKSMKGLLYIATPDYAIANVIASPAKQQNFSVSIQQLYEKTTGRWFPMQLNSDFKILNVAINGLSLYGSMRSYHRDIYLSPGLRLKDFRSVDIKINPDAGEKDSVYWSQFRAHDLTPMEARTYEFNDSIGQALNIDRRLVWLTAFTDGKFRVKFIDLDLKRILNFNLYEGLRTGIGASTNERLHPRLRLSGFAGYGWSDRLWKFGYQGAWQFLEAYNLWAGAGYSYDMVEAAQPQFYFYQRRNLLESAVRRLYITGWDYVSSAYVFVSWEWTPRFKNIVRYNREFRKHAQPYYYYNPDQSITQLTNGIALHLAEYSMEYAPNDVVTETFLGRRTVRYTFPRYFFNVTQAFSSDVGEVRFTKVDFRANFRFGRRRIGFLYTEIAGGHIQGGAPYGYLYAGRGNLYNGDIARLRRFALADRHSFETMLFNEFSMDTYAQIMLRYDTWNLFFDRKPRRPHIEFVYRALYGVNSQSSYHYGVNATAPSQVYQEFGIEINRLFSANGIGIYYRVSPSQISEITVPQILFKLTTK